MRTKEKREKKINGRKREIAKRENKKHKQSEERIKNRDVVTRFSNCSLLQNRGTYWCRPIYGLSWPSIGNEERGEEETNIFDL
jgi:hypothetical protein